jgi:hypothetical protein
MDSPIICEGITKNNVQVYLHGNGEVSDRMHFYRGKLKSHNMREIFADLLETDEQDIAKFLRERKKRG